MNIVRKDLDNNTAQLHLHIEKADYAEKVNKALRNYRQKANIPGFRPGHVPLGLIQRMYGKAVLAEEINQLIGDALSNYVQENKLQLLGEALPNESEQGEIDFGTQEDFEFIFDIALAPEFEVEMNKKDTINYYNIEASDVMVENQMKAYTGRYGKYTQEEEAQEKDMLKGQLLELKDGKINEAGVKVENAVLTPAYIKDEEQKKLFDKVKKGDIVVFNPQKAFGDKAEVASLLNLSKDAAQEIQSDFQYSIQSITRYVEAEVNQELFDKVYGEGVVKSEEEFREKIRENIVENLTADSNYKFGIDARAFFLKKYENLSFPDDFLKRWVLASNKNMTSEQVEENYPQMLADLKWHLIKDKLAKANEVKVEFDDVKEQAKKLAKAQLAQYGIIGMDDNVISNYADDMLKREETVKSLFEKVAEEKVLEVIKTTVKLTNKTVSIDEFNKMFEAESH